MTTGQEYHVNIKFICDNCSDGNAPAEEMSMMAEAAVDGGNNNNNNDNDEDEDSDDDNGGEEKIDARIDERNNKEAVEVEVVEKHLGLRAGKSRGGAGDDDVEVKINERPADDVDSDTEIEYEMDESKNSFL